MPGIVVGRERTFPQTEWVGYDESMSDSFLENLDVFYGELTPARATVYARLEGLENAWQYSLTGVVRGPRCVYSATLPSIYRLIPTGQSIVVSAKCIVTDPCYWSPENPNIYDVAVELRRGKEIIASEIRQIGFRPLGISGKFFTWGGKPWVLRAVSRVSAMNQDVSAWRERSAVLRVDDPTCDKELQDASERGTMIYVTLNQLDNLSADEVVETVKQLSTYPAVAFFDSPWNVGESLQRAAPNVLIVQGDRSLRVVCADAAQANRLKDWQMPVLMHRLLPQPAPLSDARAACDKLQADLAPYGQFAGYIV